MGAGLRPGAKAPEQPPDSNAGAPAPESTNSAKSFGFLVPDDGSPDVFCHATAVSDTGYDTLPQGAAATCEVMEGRRGPVVSSIVAVDASTAAADGGGRDKRWRERRDRGWGQDEAVGL